MSDDIAIKIEHLSKKYKLRHQTISDDGTSSNELWALKDICLTIKKGESVGVFGDNGSGKSTLLKLLAGITKPTEGKIHIKGKVASILDIGAGFHPDLSGRENVFLNGQLLGFSKKELTEKYDEIVEFSGIGRFINEPVKTYSNGMYLRLAFSILTHLKFDVYLLDEVMSVGDVAFNEKSKFLLFEIINSDATVLIVSHSMGFIGEMCNTFIQLKQGEIIKTGKSVDIVSDYARDSLAGMESKQINTHGHDQSNIVLKEVVLNGDTDTAGGFYKDSAIEVIINFEKKISDSVLFVGFTLTDSFNNTFLSSTPNPAQWLQNREKGYYVATSVIQPNLLNTKDFFLNLFFFSPNGEIAAWYYRIQSFSVVLRVEGNDESASNFKSPTPMAPVLDWSVKRIVE